MAVTLPRIERAAPQAPESVGRLEINPPSVAEATQPAFSAITKASSGIAEAYVARQNEIRKQAITAMDIKSSDIANQFENWSKQKLDEIKLKDGDTTPDYTTYDAEADKRQSEIMAQYANLDPEFQSILNNKLRTTYGKQETFRNMQQTEQTYKYRRKVVDDTVKLNQDGFFNLGLSVDTTKPDSFLALQSYRDGIIQSRIAEGDQRGVLRRDENGVPLWLDGEVGIQVRKDVGDAVIPLVKSLNAAGKVNEARKIIDDYADYMNAGDRSKLLSDSDEANVKNQALVALQEMETLLKRPPTTKEIENYKPDGKSTLSEAVQFKMLEVNDVKGRLTKNEEDRKSDAKLAQAMSRITSKMNSPQPYVPGEYVNSNEFKAETEGMRPNDIQTLLRAAEQRTVSDNKAYEKLFTAFQSGELASMPFAEYQNYITKLNKNDSNFIEGLYKQQTSPAGYSEKLAITSNAVAGLDARVDGFPDKYGKPAFVKNKKGKYSEEDRALILEAKANIAKKLDNAKVQYNAEQIQSLVSEELQTIVNKKEEGKSRAKQMLEEAIFNKGNQIRQLIDESTSNLFGFSKIPLQTVRPSNGEAGQTTNTETSLSKVKTESSTDMSTWNNDKWYTSFQEQMGRKPKDVSELRTFKQEKLKTK